MPHIDLQDQCEIGQQQLMRMEYLAAETTLASAEELAWARRDFDTLARLYLPLQEARRQRRQRCGEGIVRLDLLAGAPDDQPDPNSLIEQYPHGQLLIAGWQSIEPAVRFRELQSQQRRFVDTFLAAGYPIGERRAVVIVPLPEVTMPVGRWNSIDALLPRLPAHSIVLAEDEVPRGSCVGTAETYGQIMAIWERLHQPFLAAADQCEDPWQQMEGYRKTIRVDYACELAHQRASHVAKALARQRN